MRFLTLLLLFLFTAQTHLSAFSSLPVQSDCDTILTQKGKTLIVRIVSSDKERVRYQYCGDSSSAVIRFITTKNVKEIRPGKKTEIKITPEPEPDPVAVTPPTDSTSKSISTDIPDDAVKVDPESERKRAIRLTKTAALFSFGSLFLLFFAFAFSLALLWLLLPMYIIGLVASVKAFRATRRRPEFAKLKRLATASLAISLVMSGFVLVYILVLFIVLLYLIIFFV